MAAERQYEHLSVRPSRSPRDASDLSIARGRAARTFRRIAYGQVLTDALCLVVALSVSYVARFGFSPLPPDWLIAAAVSPFVWIAVFSAFRLYSPQHLSSWDEFSRTISASSLAIVVVALMSYWSKSSFSRIWIGLTWIFALVLELVSRRMWRWYVRRRTIAGTLAFRTLVVGANREAVRLSTELAVPGSGYLPVGHIRAGSADVVEGAVPSVGTLADLRDAISLFGAECLFVVASDLEAEQVSDVIQIARQTETEVNVSSGIPEMLARRLTVQSVGSFMALSLRPVRLTGLQVAAKRLFDLAVAIPGLLLSSPVIIGVAAAIRIESRGPAFFSQDRVTKGGKVFRMLKFRTMFEDANERLERDGIDVTAPFFKLEDDPRLTRVGRVLRRLSLDELPQLWNVIRGDMSLVGPRPLPAEQVEANRELLAPRLEVHAGMTGWWQVHGRSNIAPEDSVKLDVFYIENWSLTLDIYILLKTLGAVARGTGAF